MVIIRRVSKCLQKGMVSNSSFVCERVRVNDTCLDIADTSHKENSKSEFHGEQLSTNYREQW
jgi:hypothetical protein